MSTGTTLVALEFEGGVVIGADSKTSMGSWVANRVTDKLTPVTDTIFACRSGSAADTQVRLNGSFCKRLTTLHIYKYACKSYTDMGGDMCYHV